MKTRISRTRTALLLCSSVLGFSPLAAQTVPADQAAAAGNSATDETTGEIVVTALRSSQSLQETPAAVTVASGDLMAKAQILDVRGLQSVVPGVKFAATYNSTKIFIRGVGSLLDFYWIPELTATNVNGVYMPRYTINGAMYDIESAQLLPGPQGVLYGRSAGGGALLLNSRRPVFDNQASGSIQYGNYDAFRAEAMGNLQLSDTFAVRAAGFYSKRDGFQSNDMMSDDSLGARLSALWQPTSDTSLFLWATHYRQNGNPIGTQYYAYVDPKKPWYIPPRDPLTNNSNVGGFSKLKYSIVGYDAKFTLGGANISYRGSYMRQTERALTKLTGNNRTVDNGQKQYTQDLTISGDIGIVSLIGGASYFHADSVYDTRFGPNQFGNIFPSINNDSYSFFGQATVSLTDRFRAVGGARWSRDHLSLNGTGISCFAVCNFPPITFSDTWRHADWKAGIEFDAADRVMAYANVQTGYAPGTLNTFTNTVTISKEITPQTLLAYTAGVKSELLDRKVTLNLEAYSYEYKKLIIQAFNSQVGAQTLFNVPKAKVYGGQATMIVKPWTGGVFTGNLAYTHGRYGSYRTAPTARDLKGLQMQFAPDWTGTISYDQRFELTNGSHFDARIATYFSSSYWGTFDHSGAARQGAFNKSDASLTWYAPGDRFNVGVFVNNIENEPVAASVSALATVVQPYTAAVFLEPPRTYGVKAGFQF